MKTLKLLTATMLLLVAMAAGAETISDVTIGNLVYSLDTDIKVATVTGYDSSNKPTDVVIPNTIEYGGKIILWRLLESGLFLIALPLHPSTYLTL